jgi:hypothetical protein
MPVHPQLHCAVTDGLDRHTADVPCAAGHHQPSQPFTGVGPKSPVLRHGVRRDQRDRHTAPGKGSRRLTADEARADHQRGIGT